MGLFDIFKRKPQKNKYQVYHESITAILKLLNRKIKLVEHLENGKSIIDLEFDTLMVERMTLVQLIKSGSVSFLGDDFKNDLLEIFNDQEIKKEEIMNILKYLHNEQNKLVTLF